MSKASDHAARVFCGTILRGRSLSANGGAADINPKQDLGFMYNRNLADPDGHVWEAIWMKPA